MSKSLKDWVNARIAAEILGCPRHSMPKIAAAEGVRVLAVPGSHPMYYRKDVESLLRRCVKNGPHPELAGV